jgi:L-seryl-tRNA(Ser) seleniumtransferase
VAPLLRAGDPAVLPRIHAGDCLVDVRCVPQSEDATLLIAVQTALAELDRR